VCAENLSGAISTMGKKQMQDKGRRQNGPVETLEWGGFMAFTDKSLLNGMSTKKKDHISPLLGGEAKKNWGTYERPLKQGEGGIN